MEHSPYSHPSERYRTTVQTSIERLFSYPSTGMGEQVVAGEGAKYRTWVREDAYFVIAKHAVDADKPYDHVTLQRVTHGERTADLYDVCTYRYVPLTGELSVSHNLFDVAEIFRFGAHPETMRTEDDPVYNALEARITVPEETHYNDFLKDLDSFARSVED